MRTNRLILFIISIVVGIVAGSLFGWFVYPPKKVGNMPMASLRSDFKADYVLMVAETYQMEDDIALAKSRLAVLGDEDVLKQVQLSNSVAEDINYSNYDLELISSLSDALELGSMLQEMEQDDGGS